MKLEYTITKKDANKSIHTILKSELHLSTRLLQKLIKNQCIYRNQKKCNTQDIPDLKDKIEIDLNSIEDNSNIVPTKMQLTILYEDEWLLVVDKPAGIPIHPSRLHYTDSLSNGIKFYFDSIGLPKKIRPVNRLDLDTSGLVIFAKCEYIQEAFSQQMTLQQFQKEYLCLVHALLEKKIGIIDLPIARKKGSIIERCIDPQKGQASITHYEVLKESENYSLVKCRLETGRTHQIRVHMASIGHPILGDTLYGNISDQIARQALHSHQIQCIHPVTQKKLVFQSNLPDDMMKLVRNLK